MDIEDRNYYNDRRVKARDRKSIFESINENRMIGIIILSLEDGSEEEIEVPIKFEVCSICEGKGHHVNPSIDSNGLTADDFAEDPDFIDEYMNGTYDVNCYKCNGNKVTSTIDEEKCSKEIKERVDKLIEEREEHENMRNSERRYEA